MIVYSIRVNTFPVTAVSITSIIDGYVFVTQLDKKAYSGRNPLGTNEEQLLVRELQSILKARSQGTMSTIALS